jgi:hypothetical protein
MFHTNNKNWGFLGLPGATSGTSKSCRRRGLPGATWGHLRPPEATSGTSKSCRHRRLLGATRGHLGPLGWGHLGSPLVQANPADTGGYLGLPGLLGATWGHLWYQQILRTQEPTGYLGPPGATWGHPGTPLIPAKSVDTVSYLMPTQEATGCLGPFGATRGRGTDHEHEINPKP